jgi:hypothetical protein
MKFALRKFRHGIKSMYHEGVTRNVMFNWRSSRDIRLIDSIKNFYCNVRNKDPSQSFMIPEKIFERHKVIFCELILNFKIPDRYKDYGMQGSNFLNIIREVMGSMPNRKNLI